MRYVVERRIVDGRLASSWGKQNLGSVYFRTRSEADFARLEEQVRATAALLAEHPNTTSRYEFRTKEVSDAVDTAALYQAYERGATRHRDYTVSDGSYMPTASELLSMSTEEYRTLVETTVPIPGVAF